MLKVKKRNNDVHLYLQVYNRLLPSSNSQLLKEIIEPGNANLEETDNRMF